MNLNKTFTYTYYQCVYCGRTTDNPYRPYHDLMCPHCEMGELKKIEEKVDMNDSDIPF